MKRISVSRPGGVIQVDVFLKKADVEHIKALRAKHNLGYVNLDTLAAFWLDCQAEYSHLPNPKPVITK